MANMLITASSYAHSGLSVIPTRADKRPACAWKIYTERPMSDREIENYFRGADGIGIVTGKVSGNLELLDFDDGGSAFEPWFCQIPTYLAQRLVVEQSPSGGKHVYYRIEDAVPGNRKLALKEDGHVLIETRGEGGYVKCAPSVGYEVMAGDLRKIPVISAFEHQLLIDAALKLNEKVSAITTSPTGPHKTNTGTEVRLDRPSPYEIDTMKNALLAAGWTLTPKGAEENWTRPGKTDGSTSATFNGEVFYVFSTNATPFEANRGYSVRGVLRVLRGEAYTPIAFHSTSSESSTEEAPVDSPVDPGSIPEELLHVPGFVDLLAEHTLACAPYPNRALAFAGALTMLAHLTGRNYRDSRNLRTNLYLIALADSGVGKDFPRKVNMNLATELGIMGGMADRFASAEGLEDALLVRPCSFFQVDEVDTLFASLADHGDSAMEKVYGALLQFATSADTTYAMRKKAIQQAGGKAGKFDRIRARGIREPHLTLLGTAIPKYLFSAVSERALENGLLSRCLVIEAGERGKAGTPHHASFTPELLEMARAFVSHGGFDGLDLDNLDTEPAPYIEPYTVNETDEACAARENVVARCEAYYAAAKTTAEKALWTRGAEKVSRLALLYALSENPYDPLITDVAVNWAWKLVEHLTKRLLFQASVYVHDNEFDALRQKAIRYLRDYGTHGALTHGALLRYMHIDSDTFRKVIETLVQSELISATPLSRGGFRYAILGVL